MKKILTVLGTRPEAIKLVPVIRRLKRRSSQFESKVCVTSQHREMLDQVLKIFHIHPDYDLGIMKQNQDLFHVTSAALLKLKKVLMAEKPELVLVQGDTTTSFVASLASFYLKIPVGHVEAGLRTNDNFNPYPEEANRHMLSVLADYHFAPTCWAKANLLGEKVSEEKIWVTGNTVIDALLLIHNRQKRSRIQKRWIMYFKDKFKILLNSDQYKILLVTGHRRENFGKGLENICQALREIAERRKDVMIVYPVHLNPNVQKPVKSILKRQRDIHLIEPLEYEPFVFLMSHSYLILTDSGGIQEEAPSLSKPVLVMRNVTERPEGIEAGTAELVGTEKDSIVAKTLGLLENPSDYEKMARASNPYGDGKASERIAEILLKL